MQAASLASPQTLNMYTYCGNDPVNYTDPSGLFFGKLFKWLGKLFKLINRILLVVVIVIGVILLTALVLSYTPYMLPGWLGNVVGSIIGLVGKIAGGASAFIASTAGMIGIEVGGRISSSLAAGLYAVGAIASEFNGPGKKRRQRRRTSCPPLNASVMFFSRNQQLARIKRPLTLQSRITGKKEAGSIKIDPAD